jgi:hypothetical protein
VGGLGERGAGKKTVTGGVGSVGDGGVKAA